MNDMRKLGSKAKGILLIGFLTAGLSAVWGGRVYAAPQSTEPKIVDAESVIYLDGMDRISVEGEGIQSVSYSSSAKKVAKIDRNGKVTPMKKGTAAIRAKVTYKKNGQSVEKTLSYRLRVFGKSTEYFQYTKNSSQVDARSYIYGLTKKGRTLKDVYIPGYHDGVAVRCVDCRVFRNNKKLERVYTSDQTSDLDYGAGDIDGARENFQGCTNLKEIHLGKNVSSVGFRKDLSALERITVDERNRTYHLRDGVLFEGKGRLICYPAGRKDKEYTIPQNVHYVEECAFSGAKHLKMVHFPKGIKYITGAFRNSGLTEVAVPSSIESYSGAFADCDALEKTVIETKAHAYQAFYGCGKLKSVRICSIPSGDNFGGCGSLERFELTSDVKNVTIRDDVLYSGDGKKLLVYPAGKRMEEYALAAGTKKIAPSAFCGVRHLKHVRMNQELVGIGESAFQGAEISQVTLNQGLEEIGESAFSDSHLSKIIIPDSVNEIGSTAFSGCTKLQSVHLPKRIRALKYNLFWNCTGLTKLHIPASVRSCDSELTSGCRNLARITVARKSKYFVSINGVLYSKSKKTLYAYPAAKRGAKYVISKSVQEIKSQAFMGNRYLKRVAMKDGVVRIGLEAFRDMHSLRNVTLSKKLKKIENGTFAGCEKLESLDIPDQVTVVGNEAFENCAGLKRVTVGRKVKRIYRYAFTDCIGMRKIIFQNKNVALGDKEWWNIDRNVVFDNTGSRNYRRLAVLFPSCNQKQKKMVKAKLHRYGLNKKAKVVFGKGK